MILRTLEPQHERDAGITVFIENKSNVQSLLDF